MKHELETNLIAKMTPKDHLVERDTKKSKVALALWKKKEDHEKHQMSMYRSKQSTELLSDVTITKYSDGVQISKEILLKDSVYIRKTKERVI